MEQEYEDRISKAVELFMSGYNCAQSVVGAFADLYGIDDDTAFRMSASFGSGIGRMRLTCGAASGMFMLAGLEKGSLVPDINARRENYQLVQQLAATFRERNGSICCAELLNLRKGENSSPNPDARTAEYYKKRPCARMIESAARIWAEHLIKVKKNDE